MFLQQLALLQGFDIGAMDPVGPDFVHTVVECAKLAYADREAYYGDVPDVPLGTCCRPPTTTSGASWWATTPRSSCGRVDVPGRTRLGRPRRGRPLADADARRPAPASRPSPASA